MGLKSVQICRETAYRRKLSLWTRFSSVILWPSALLRNSRKSSDALVVTRKRLSLFDKILTIFFFLKSCPEKRSIDPRPSLNLTVKNLFSVLWHLVPYEFLATIQVFVKLNVRK